MDERQNVSILENTVGLEIVFVQVVSAKADRPSGPGLMTTGAGA